MLIFEALGTPTDSDSDSDARGDWPGVSRLPHYSPTFPTWPPRPPASLLLAAPRPPVIDALVDGLLRLDPARRCLHCLRPGPSSSNQVGLSESRGIAGRRLAIRDAAKLSASATRPTLRCEPPWVQP